MKGSCLFLGPSQLGWQREGLRHANPCNPSDSSVWLYARKGTVLTGAWDTEACVEKWAFEGSAMRSFKRGVLFMPTEKNPVREMRESLNLNQKEFAAQAGVTLGTLRMVEGGGYLLLSRLVAEKLAAIFPNTTPEKLKGEYATWRKQAEAEKEQRS